MQYYITCKLNTLSSNICYINEANSTLSMETAAGVVARGGGGGELQDAYDTRYGTRGGFGC